MSIHYDVDYDCEYMNLKFNKSNVSNVSNVSNLSNVTKKQSRAAKRLCKMVHENSTVEKNTRGNKRTF